MVNTTSGAGIKVFGRGAAYAAAKHGVVDLTKRRRTRWPKTALRQPRSGSCRSQPMPNLGVDAAYD
jgi:NADP-dependent 3-hydroxy acid dehydrogenase YdfG